MRTDKLVVLLNGKPWLIDFRRNRFTILPPGVHRVVANLKSLFGAFDATAAFHHWRQALQYKDYAKYETVLSEDFEENRAKHDVAEQPPLDLSELYCNAPATPLNECVNAAMASCDTLLRYSMSRISTVSFHKDTVQLRPSPSVGARHGIEVFIHINGREYYYCGASHAIRDIGPTDSQEFDLAMTFICRSDVYMWRYPYGSCLMDVYWDFGHILGNLALAAPLASVSRPQLIPNQRNEFCRLIGAMTIGTIGFNFKNADTR